MVIDSIIYVSAICAANLSVAMFGPISTVINAFLFIGLDLVLRDGMHERVGLLRMSCLSLVAGAISYAINPATGIIAVASVSAFVVSALVDGIAYQWLIKRPWLVRSNGSNLLSAATDSMVFPVIAFGGFMPLIVLGQFAAKVLGGLLWSLLLKRGIR